MVEQQQLLEVPLELGGAALFARFELRAEIGALLLTPAPTCGRATKAASPRSATRPKTMRGGSRSKIGWKNGCAVRAKISAICGASSARALALTAATTSGRISGGAIAVP